MARTMHDRTSDVETQAASSGSFSRKDVEMARKLNQRIQATQYVESCDQAADQIAEACRALSGPPEDVEHAIAKLEEALISLRGCDTRTVVGP